LFHFVAVSVHGIMVIEVVKSLFCVMVCRTYVWWYVIWSVHAERCTCCCKVYTRRMDSAPVCFWFVHM